MHFYLLVYLSIYLSISNVGNVQPPFILVGHSLGAFYAQLYGQTYPKEVVGMVLVDPLSEHIQDIDGGTYFI